MRTAALILSLLAPAAAADVTVTFIEGAPTDRFVIASNADCALGDAQLAIDLGGSAGGLIFDVTSAGQGVEVFQPLTLVSGADQVRAISEITDGGTQLTVDLQALQADRPVAFTLDLDDTLGGREITVSGAEIAGATVTLASAGSVQSATFDTAARARLDGFGCTS